jgi:hypothetical protein
VASRNTELVRRYYERVVDKNRLDELAAFIHAEYVDHNSESNERGPSLVSGSPRSPARHLS